MSSILTLRQTLELHKAIVQYLAPILENEPETYKTVCQALDTSADLCTVPQYLEKKWLTVLRLQKRILDLENETNSYKQLIAAADGIGIGGVPGGKKINWLPQTVARVYPTQTQQIVNAVAVHPTLPLLTAGCADGSMVTWTLAGGEDTIPQKVWNAHTRSIHGLRWSHIPVDLTGSGSGHNIETYVLASCLSDLLIKLWAGDQFTHVRTLTGHEHTVSAVAFLPTRATYLYSVSRDRTVKIWDLATGYCVSSFVGHSDWVRDIDVAAVNCTLAGAVAKKLAPLGDFLLTCSNDQSVRLSHHLGTGLAMLLGHTHVVERVRFLPPLANIHIDAFLTKNIDRFPHLLTAIVENPIYAETLGFKYCVSAGRDNVLKLWLVPPPVIFPHRPPMPALQNNSQGWHLLDLLGHQSWIKSIDVHPNGRFIVSGSDDKTIRVWDLESLLVLGTVACVQTLKAHEGFINALHFARSEPKANASTDSAEDALKAIEATMRCLFVSAGTDNTVRLWQ